MCALFYVLTLFSVRYDRWAEGYPVGLGDITNSSFCMTAKLNNNSDGYEWFNTGCNQFETVICVKGTSK